jgi:hypothetical protein
VYRTYNRSHIHHFQTIICREIKIAKIWFYYLILHHCKNQRFLKPFTAHTSDLLELTSLSNKFDGHNQGKPDNFADFCSRAKMTVFQTHTSDLHRFCSNRLVRRTKTQTINCQMDKTKFTLGKFSFPGFFANNQMQHKNFLVFCLKRSNSMSTILKRRLFL